MLPCVPNIPCIQGNFFKAVIHCLGNCLDISCRNTAEGKFSDSFWSGIIVPDKIHIYGRDLRRSRYIIALIEFIGNFAVQVIQSFPACPSQGMYDARMQYPAGPALLEDLSAVYGKPYSADNGLHGNRIYFHFHYNGAPARAGESIKINAFAVNPALPPAVFG